MKKLYLIIACAVFLASCGSVGISVFDVDQISPAMVTFPDQIHKVGVVDRVNVKAGEDKHNMFGISSLDLMEDLAGRIAESEYFADVILCDSDISSWGIENNRILPLQQNQVRDLCEDLQTDLILSLEQVSSHALSAAESSSIELESGVRIYAPGKSKPLALLHVKDTIAWDLPEGYSITIEAARQDIVSYLSESLGKQIVPTWQSVSRYYFDGGNADMRDGGYYVRQGDWDSAKEIWEQAYSTAKGKLKEQYAYNLVLCEEMQGNISEALSLCEELLARVSDYNDVRTLVVIYHRDLVKRASDVARLNLQMNRIR